MWPFCSYFDIFSFFKPSCNLSLPMACSAEDRLFPVEPAAGADCSLCSEAPCCIRLCAPFHRKPHPNTWMSGSSEGKLLEQNNRTTGWVIKKIQNGHGLTQLCIAIKLLINACIIYSWNQIFACSKYKHLFLTVWT